MGKAYSEEEKKEIDRKIKEIAREMFREKGLKDVSIMDITKAVGISQGGFYNFYKNKELLLLTIMIERARDKQRVVIEQLPGSEKNPQEFLIDAIIYFWKILKNSKALFHIDTGILNLIWENKDWFITKQKEELKQMFNTFREYWEAHQASVFFDTEAVIGIFYTTSILYMNLTELPKKLSEELAEEHARHMIQKYVTVNVVSDKGGKR